MKVLLEQIKPNAENPRNISTAQFKKLVQSIKDFPEMLETRPLVIDEDFIVLGGNMRLKALKELGYTEIPVHQVTDWTEEQKKQFIIKDNLSFGTWDYKMLEEQWNVTELDDWGFDIKTLEPAKEKVREDTYDPRNDIPTDIKIGDLIEKRQHVGPEVLPVPAGHIQTADRASKKRRSRIRMACRHQRVNLPSSI